MGGATPHGGVEPSVGPKTVVVGFPRVVVVCLLALAELARRKAAAVVGMNVDKRRYLIGFHQPPGKLDLVTVISTLAYGMSPKIGLVLCTRIYCDWL